jgi:hypothetical protein
MLNKKCYFWDFISFFLILFAPYLIYIFHIDFLFELSNLFVIAGFATISALLAIGLWFYPSPVLRTVIHATLLLLFIDIQFEWIDGGYKRVAATALTLLVISWILRRHISQILVVMFGTIIVMTIGTPILNQLFHDNTEIQNITPHRKTDLPVYVHIILDEHLGIEGFDEAVPSQKALKLELTHFYSEHSFRIYGRAYSQYFNTRDSISSSLSLKTTTNPDPLYSQNSSIFSYTLLNNVYFEKVLSKGYDINIYQSTYMDYCSSIKKGLGKCITYNKNGASSTALKGLKSGEKTNVVLSSYMGLSFILKETNKIYKERESYLGLNKFSLPDLMRRTLRIGPISTLPVFDTLIEDISSSQGGTMFFAHLLIPHYPYSVDSACQIRRPVMEWTSRRFNSHSSGLENSPQSRLARYEEYIPQVQCVLSKLKVLLDAMKANGTFEDAIIIIHGDHGSRIVQVAPVTENIARLSSQDFYDSFSTLYVLKSPEIKPGYDKRMLALPRLLSDTVSGRLTTLASANKEVNPFVFLRGGKGTQHELLKVPIPEIPIK